MKWYRSLYWRIAIAFVLFLAAMLAAQAMLFVWSVALSGRSAPEDSPQRFAATVAVDVAGALERDPQLDVAHYLRDQYAQVTHPFFVMLSGGRVITVGSDSFPEPLMRMARQRLLRGDAAPFGPGGGWRARGGGDPSHPPGEGFRPGEGPGFRMMSRPVPIIVNGTLAGVVVAPPRAPFAFVLSRFAPTLLPVALGVLIVGTVLVSLVVFGPARRRLVAVEAAARRLGRGDLSARAPERGGDEIASVAHAFNAMADDLAARAEALQSSDRARRQLLADVSHELTTPVTAMRGYLETLTMPELTLDAPTRDRYLRIISDETARLERIIGDLLDLARLEGGGGELHIERVPVAQLFERVEARHGRAAEAAQVRLASEIAPGAETVTGDRDRLEQALQNLAANALRFAPPQSTLRLSARPAGNAIVLSVEDEGPGIEADHLPRIFDRFYKADASREGTSGGSGLGLSIVKAIVERHGGRVTVESRPGRTRFEIELKS